jgi:hypothetical protein
LRKHPAPGEAAVTWFKSKSKSKSKSDPPALSSFVLPPCHPSGVNVPRSASTAADSSPPPAEAIFVSVKDAQKMLGLSRNQVYDLLWQGRIESRYFGRRRLVVLDSLRTFADNLPTERAEG